MHGGGPPSGLPSDWTRLAIAAAADQLTKCAQADVLAPAGCPQSAAPADPNASAGAVHWTLLQQLTAGSVALVQPLGIEATNTSGAGTAVTVYGRFQMVASYTLTDSSGGTTTRLAYSAGIAQATMTWAGTSFENVAYTSGPVRQLPVGVTVPSFTQPSSVTGAALNAAVAAGFQACATSVPAADGPGVPNCPQTVSPPAGATNASWSLDADPLQGATTGFDASQGLFTVTGTYTMTLSYLPQNTDGTVATDPETVSVTGTYTASLYFDGAHVELLGISG